MKCVSLAVLCTLLAVGSAWAQAPVPASGAGGSSKSVFIDASESTGDSKTTNNWRYSDGSYSKTKVATRELNITVRNMSALPGQFTVEWFFVGKPSSGTRRFLYDKGQRNVTLAPSAFEKISVESKELTSNSVRDYYYYGYSYKSGDKPDGWIIRAKVGDEVVRVKTSSPQLDQLESNKAEFERFVGTMDSKKKSP